MGGITLKAVFRPQFIGESEKHNVVSLFADADEKKKSEKKNDLDDDSNDDESDADPRFKGQLFNYDFAMESGRK